ncbi:MAG: (Fe-S)-binding protein [Chloroflexi bacterium]|nr:(Fe-S)-binding protein [Chloroflexota bacterium]
MALAEIQAYLESQRQAVLERCTACGKCVQVCPMLPHLEIRDLPAESIAHGILALLHGEYERAGATFAEACAGSAYCSQVCPAHLDPYDLTRLAKLAASTLRAAKAPPAPRLNLFQMIELARCLQMPKDETRWFTGRPPEGLKAEVVFYLGCNILRTPHIVLNLVDVLERLGVDFQTLGSGGNCCGILQFREGKLAGADAITSNTFQHFAMLSPRQVIVWCPTCELHFNDFGATYLERPCRILHYTRFLVERLDQVQARIVQPIRARVALEEHAPLGAEDSVMDDARTVLRAIPGLELVEVPQHRYGYQCAAVRNRTALSAGLRTICQSAASAGVDYLVSLYHSCHRELVRAEEEYPFKVVNFSSLLAQAFGMEREDTYRRLKLLPSAEAVLQEVLATVGQNGHSLEELQRAIKWEFGR